MHIESADAVRGWPRRVPAPLEGRSGVGSAGAAYVGPHIPGRVSCGHPVSGDGAAVLQDAPRLSHAASAAACWRRYAPHAHGWSFRDMLIRTLVFGGLLKGLLLCEFVGVCESGFMPC
jgi:hypothetical protein